MAQETEKLKQPAGLYLISFTSIWERFSYYGMRAFLILYMANDVMNGGPKAHLGGLGIKENTAGLIYGLFTGSCYILPLLGGFIADRFIGKRRSVLLGGILIMIGHFTLAANFADNFGIFIAGLTVLAMGNGFFKPSAPTMIGDLYKPDDKRRDSAFTIYYFMFNGGAFLAPIICGYFGETYLYRWGFFVAGIGMCIGLIIYILFAPKYLGEIGKVPIHTLNKQNNVAKEPLTKDERDRISVIVILLFFVTFFWAGFEQAGSTLTLFADKYINKTVFGWEIPTSWMQSINPIFIVLLGPLFSALWMKLSNRGKNPASPIKMGMGMIALGMGFIFMIGAVLQRGGNNPDTSVKAGLIWLVATYLMHTVGELLLSPIGLSMVTKLAPVRLAALFMGVWYLGSFIANMLSGISVKFVNQYGALAIFSCIAIFVGLLGVVVLLISRWLIGKMHGVEK
jgi:proton-dependent oligopeptide transporter, POT family